MGGIQDATHWPDFWSDFSRETYDNIALLPENQRFLTRISELVGKGKYVLDAGCGTGNLTRHVANGNEVIGVDFSPGMLAVARLKLADKQNVGLVQGNVQDLLFKDELFDAVCSANVLFNLEDPGKALREIFRVLKPGGSFVVSSQAKNAFEKNPREKIIADAASAQISMEKIEAIWKYQLYMAENNGFKYAPSLEEICHVLEETGFKIEVREAAYYDCNFLVSARKPAKARTPLPQEIFQRAVNAHLSQRDFELLQGATVLVAGLGGGSNMAELLVRKGIGKLIIADPDVFEEHNIRQRGCTMKTLGSNKTHVMAHRLTEINPHLKLKSVPGGVTLQNVEALVGECDIVLDMLDFSALEERILLHRATRAQKKYAVTAPSMINGAILMVFKPEDDGMEQAIGYQPGKKINDLGQDIIHNLFTDFPPEAPKQLYLSAARGERTLPIDAVGVDQASVLAVQAIENLILNRLDRIIFYPDVLRVDLSRPDFLAKSVRLSG